MHCTLPVLLAIEVMSYLVFLTGKPAIDLRPVNGATMLPRLTVVTAGEDIIEEAISFSLISFYSYSENGATMLFVCLRCKPSTTKLAVYRDQMTSKNWGDWLVPNLNRWIVKMIALKHISHTRMENFECWPHGILWPYLLHKYSIYHIRHGLS